MITYEKPEMPNLAYDRIADAIPQGRPAPLANLHDQIMEMAKNADVDDIRRRVDELLRPLDPLTRHVTIGKMRDELHREEVELLAKRSRSRVNRAEIELTRDILSDIMAWDEGGITIQKAMSSRAHEFARALDAGNVYGLTFPPKDVQDERLAPLVTYTAEEKPKGEIFIVEHDCGGIRWGAGVWGRRIPPAVRALRVRVLLRRSETDSARAPVRRAGRTGGASVRRIAIC